MKEGSHGKKITKHGLINGTEFEFREIILIKWSLVRIKKINEFFVLHKKSGSFSRE